MPTGMPCLLFRPGGLRAAGLLGVICPPVGVSDASFLRQNRRYAILIAFVIAVILTPTPDVINQPDGGALIVLCEISIIAAQFAGRPKEGVAG